MNVKTVVLLAQEFFHDLIGRVVPGVILLYGSALLLAVPTIGGGNAAAVGLLVLSYVFGHALTRLTYWLARAIRRSSDPYDAVDQRIRSSGSFKQFRRLVGAPPDAKVNELRNQAMTLIGDDVQTVYRFRFLGLFNGNTATAIGLLVVLSVIVEIQGSVAGNLGLEQGWQWSLGLGITGVVLTFLLWENASNFYSIARRVPFDMAIGEISKSEKPALSEQRAPGIEGRRTVYLAGGHYSGWQDTVKKQVTGFRYLDPRSHGISDPASYTAWDLSAIAASQLVFAFLEDDNPGGFGLALEVGYAKGIGKRVILVDEKSLAAKTRGDRAYLEMVRAAADDTYETLEEGIARLGEVKQAT